MQGFFFTMLFLIPVPLSEPQSLQSIPVQTPALVSRLRLFFVEELRTARRFIRACGYSGDFSDIQLIEIGKKQNPEEFSAGLDRLRNEDAGILSESGMPCVADPGAELVALAHRNQIPVSPLPGPSSILQTLAASGMSGQTFSFHGYLPIRQEELPIAIKNLVRDIQKSGATQLFIETPFRVQKMLNTLLQELPEEITLCVGINIGMNDEKIISQKPSQWKKNIPDLNKKLVVFALGKYPSLAHS